MHHSYVGVGVLCCGREYSQRATCFHGTMFVRGHLNAPQYFEKQQLAEAGRTWMVARLQIMH